MAVRFLHPDQGITRTGFSAQTIAAIVDDGSLQDFSIWGWISAYVAPIAGPMYNLLRLHDAAGDPVLTMRYWPSATRLRASVWDDQAVERNSDILTFAQPAAGELILWCLSCASGTLSLYAVRSSDGIVISTAGSVSAGSLTILDPADAVIGGHDASTWKAYPGSYYGVYLRTHSATEADVQAVWDSRSVLAPMFAADIGDGMNGIAGCQWAMGIGGTGRVQWSDATSTSNAGEMPLPGAQINTLLRIFDKNGPNGAGPNPQYYTYRPVTVARAGSTGPLHDSWMAPATSHSHRHFVVPPAPGSVAANVPGGGEATRRLALGRPKGLIRVSAHSNSRATAKTHTPDLAGNFLVGMQMVMPDQIAGVDLIQLQHLDYIGGTGQGDWGLSAAQSQPKMSGVLAQRNLSAINGGTLGRYSWRRAGSSGPGPGDMIEVGAGETFRWLCEPRGLATADRSLATALHYFTWPRGGRFRWRRCRDVQQGVTSSEIVGEWSDWITTATATALAHELTSTEASSYNDSAKTIVLTGTGLSVSAGQICVRGDTYDVANVASAVEAGGNTTVTFDFAFASAPQESEVLHFGDWDYRRLLVEHDAVGASPINWRGIEVEAEDATAYGVATIGAGAWALGVDGFVCVPMGVGGTTFPQQLAAINVTGPTGAESGPRDRFLRDVVDADVAIMLTNFLSGGYEDMGALLIDAGAEVLCWGDADYEFPAGGTDYAEQCDLLRAAAMSLASPYISTYDAMGVPYETISLGEIMDVPAHQTPAFYARMWRAGLASLLDVTEGIELSDPGSILDQVNAIRALAEADQQVLLDGDDYVLRTYARGTTTELIPAKKVLRPGGAGLTNPATQQLGGYEEVP